MSKMVLFFVSAAFFAGEFTLQATAEDSLSDLTHAEKHFKSAAQEEQIAALDKQIAAFRGKHAIADPRASTTDLRDSAMLAYDASITDSEKSWTLVDYVGGNKGQFASTPPQAPENDEGGTYGPNDGKNYCEVLCKTMPGCTKFQITNEWNIGYCNFYKGSAGPYPQGPDQRRRTIWSADQRRRASALYAIGSTTVPNNHWLVAPGSIPKIGNPQTKSFAVETSAAGTPVGNCYPVVPFRATSGSPEFNACSVCEFTDNKIDQYGCATCPAGQLPSDPSTLTDGTVICATQSTGKVQTKCSNKYSHDDVAVNWSSDYGGAASDISMIAAAQITCSNLGITTATLLNGYDAVHTVVRVGCSFWKQTACVGVWSTAVSKWLTKCASTKKSQWLFVDTCTERNDSFDWTDSSTHGSSTCSTGTKNMCHNCRRRRGNGNTAYGINLKTPEVLTTYAQLENYNAGDENEATDSQGTMLGLYFSQLAIAPAKDRLCAPTTINK